jgi:hypothetical protein
MRRYKRYHFEDIGTFLLEKTYDINKDVDYIYNKIFKPIVDKIKNDSYNVKVKEIPNFNFGGIVFKKISSADLQSSECKKAHLLNPVTIYLGSFELGSLYTGKEGLILVSVSYQAFLALETMSYKELIEMEHKNIGNKIKLDLNASTIKSSIAHELSHWLNDSLHNEFLTKLIRIATENDNHDILKLKNLDVNLTYFELDAQIHNIKQLKRDNLKIWDTITLYKLISLSPSLTKIYDDIRKLYGDAIMRIWQTNLIKRMDREKLLGKKMTPFTEKLRRFYI